MPRVDDFSPKRLRALYHYWYPEGAENARPIVRELIAEVARLRGVDLGDKLPADELQEIQADLQRQRDEMARNERAKRELRRARSTRRKARKQS